MSDDANLADYQRPQSETHLSTTTDIFSDVPAAHLADEHSRDDAYNQVNHDHEEARSSMQAAIDTVAAKHLGAPQDVVLVALRGELVERGHWPQPNAWVSAVVDSLSNGTPYHL